MPGCIKQGPSGTKVPRLDMCRSRISKSKVTHQMWCDPPKRIVGNIGGSS